MRLNNKMHQKEEMEEQDVIQEYGNRRIEYRIIRVDGR
jgi:hypothetical protein